MAKNKNEPLPNQSQVVSQQPPEPPKAPEPEPTKTPEPEPTKAPEPEPTKTPEPEPPKAQEPEPPKAQEPEQGMNAVEKAKAELERRKAESQARAVKKDVISTEPIYRSRTEK